MMTEFKRRNMNTEKILRELAETDGIDKRVRNTIIYLCEEVDYLREQLND